MIPIEYQPVSCFPYSESIHRYGLRPETVPVMKNLGEEHPKSRQLADMVYMLLTRMVLLFAHHGLFSETFEEGSYVFGKVGFRMQFCQHCEWKTQELRQYL